MRLGDDGGGRRRRRGRSGDRGRQRRRGDGVRVVDGNDHRTDAVGAAASSARVLPPGALDQTHDDVLALPLHHAAHRVVVLPLWALLQVPEVAATVAARPQEVLGQRVEDVDAVDAIVFADRDIEQHEPVVIRQRNAQRLFQTVDELAKSFQRDVLRRLLVEQFPDLVVHVEVVLRQSLLDVLGRLAEVLEDDGDVHVDDDEKADDEVGDDVGDRLGAVSAVAVGFEVRRRVVTLVLVHQRRQHAVPAGRRRDLEQNDHAVEERLEVEDVVDAVHVPDVHEEGHAEDGVDKHDEEEQQADVDQSRHRDGQREQQRPNAFGRLDESQHPADAENPNDSQ